MGKVKHKTHKGLRKRVRVSSKGKVLRKASFSGHLMSGKSGNRRRRVSDRVTMYKTDAVRTLRALGL